MEHLRAKQIFFDHFGLDKSFEDKYLFFEPRYSQREVRKIWESALEQGIEIGLIEASIDGQIINLWQKLETSRQKEFVSKLMSLYTEYGFGLQYHYKHGLITVDRNYGRGQ